MKRKGEDRLAIAIRFENIPFDMPFEKEKLTSKIRQINKTNERNVGENNCAFQFRNGKAKALLLYLDVFDTRIEDNMINSKSYKIIKMWLILNRPVMLNITVEMQQYIDIRITIS